MPNKTTQSFTSLRDFPSVEILSGDAALTRYTEVLTKPLVIQVIKDVIAGLKETFSSGEKQMTHRDLMTALTGELDRLLLLNLEPVINGTGIVIHTNLGRAPLSEEMIRQAIDMATGYSNLEFNLASGKRGKRGVLVERLLATLCGTESGTMVNNNAAALFIILNTLANRKEVIISRGELVQIGGGFKIPEIMTRSGVKLAEVGTTNRTTRQDYADAITDRTSMILKVHRSNFTQEGFVEETPLADLVSLCREHDLLLIHDLGSGLLSFPPDVHITGEPNLYESVRAGADITCFSGDKLLGGVQAGLIVGGGSVISRIKKNPLFRTIRCDKLVFSITTQVLTAYLNGTQYTDIPIWKMITIPLIDLRERGKAIHAACPGKNVALKATGAVLGGGTTPGQTIPSLALSIRSEINPSRLAKKFRTSSPPIIGRVEDEDFLLDLRTIPPDKDQLIIKAINEMVP